MALVEIFANFLIFGFFLFYWTAAFLILYHLTRFGVGVQPKRFAAVFLFGSLVLFFASVFLYSRIDFSVLT